MIDDIYDTKEYEYSGTKEFDEKLNYKTHSIITIPLIHPIRDEVLGVVQLLNKKDNVNKFLTTIGNLFVNDGSKTDEDGYRHGTINVNRNQTKSFFNYLWLNVQDGLISTLTGNGEKK